MKKYKNLQLIYDAYQTHEYYEFIEIMDKLLGKHFTNNADWGGAKVWLLKGENNFIGNFLYLGDDELLILKRTVHNDSYIDKVLVTF